MTRVGFFLAALLWAGHGRAALSTTAKAELQAHCAKIAKAVESRVIKPRFFVDLSDGKAEAERWLEFKTQAAIDIACKERPCYQTAWLYHQNGRLVLAAFTFAKASGDWANNADYYFYPNGRIAKDRSELRRFGARERGRPESTTFLVEVQRSRLYAKNGIQLPGEAALYFKVKDGAKEAIAEPDFEESPEFWPPFKRVQDLPMAKALRKATLPKAR